MIAQIPHNFDRIAAAVRGFRWRPEVSVQEIGSPQRIAPCSLAMEAEVMLEPGEPVATGRIVVLHDPAGNDAWDGQTRVVSFTQAPVDFEMAADQMLPDVAWSWLLDALHNADAGYCSASGTVTTMTSRRFGEIDAEPDVAEVEVRCSWTVRDDDQIACHVTAWQELLCQLAGLEPLTEGVVAIGRRTAGRP